MKVINGTVNDFNGKTYTNGILFWHRTSRAIQDDTDEADIIVSYPLNSQYKTLKGEIVIPKNYQLVTGSGNCDTDTVNVLFYGDGRLLYKAIAVTNFMPFKIDVDVKGVNQLNVKIASEGKSHVALTDLALYK